MKIGEYKDTFFYGVWGSSANDVYVVGSKGIILNYRNKKWQKLQAPTNQNLRGIWGSDANNIWAVGSAGTILHYNGTKWEVQEAPVLKNFTGIWGSDSSNIFVIGDGVILRYVSKKWEASLAPKISYISVWGRSADEVYATSDNKLYQYHKKNNSWQKIETPAKFSEKLRGIWGDTSNLFVVGGAYAESLILNYSQKSWKPQINYLDETLYSVWGISNKAYAVGRNVYPRTYPLIYHYNGKKWYSIGSGGQLDEQFVGVWGTKDVLFVIGGKSFVSMRVGMIWRYQLKQ